MKTLNSFLAYWTNSKHCKYLFFLIVAFLMHSFSCCFAQLSPAGPQLKPIVLLGGTLHVGNGEIIQNSAIRFDKGKIVFAGTIDGIKTDAAKEEIIDVTDKHIYPGLIAPNTILGLNEIDMARPTKDHTETGDFNPNVRTIIAYNTDSKVIPTVRSNGVLMAQIVPRGGRISGTSSVVELDAWNWEDAVYKMDDGIHMSWVNSFESDGWWAEPTPMKKKDNKNAISQFKTFLNSAQDYCKIKKPDVVNLKLEAIRGLFDGSKKLYLHNNDAKDIIAAITFLKLYHFKIVLVGGKDAWMITDILKENNISVIIHSPHTLPVNEDKDIDIPFKNAYLLHKAGILYCIGLDGSWGQRNLPFVAGTTSAYGLTKEEALISVTANTAKILGIDKSVGSLEQNKDATLVVSTGDVLDMRTNNIELAFIRGKKIDLNNHQKELYKKYVNKYGLDKN